ncbi:UNVERIFIED_CONTAM: hypothetical protein K2H54_036981 [Gekko kuhli]
MWKQKPPEKHSEVLNWALISKLEKKQQDLGGPFLMVLSQDAEVKALGGNWAQKAHTVDLARGSCQSFKHYLRNVGRSHM